MEDSKPCLNAVRELLLQEISVLTEDEFNETAENHAWSIAQICQHLVKTEILFQKALAFGLRQKQQSRPQRRPIGIVSDRSVNYQAPKVSEPDDGPFQIPQIIQQLNVARSDFLALLDSVEDKSVLKEAAVHHPRFGDLPLDQWVELLHLHERRHAEQIKELKSVLKQNLDPSRHSS
ncbi:MULTISPECIES: DinB family protein [unclassified Paenibacillus]|uniref:DinB family protein n=1 Tax=unclassified Paenibacillus TaxID=185978 RepID=UPI000953A11F|nr:MULTISPECIES: DinB family protein [unclassified Paenibacillus]ASS66789.1 DinB family protein [Paenibacillus sp. RUD330]SIP95381.1 DinB superfamily protein [Paenibacillus sp. RU4X]SIQ13887.1 DinB superfamily protein [Paenibacillus sp. RU4T]